MSVAPSPGPEPRPEGTPPRRLRLVAGLVPLVLALAGLGLSRTPPTDPPDLAERGISRVLARYLLAPDEDEAGECDEDAGRSLTLPTGQPSALACDDARRVVAQARRTLAAHVAPVDPRKFGDAAVDWLDPHGLWSVAPDAHAGALVRQRAVELVAELEAPPGSGPCAVADDVGRELAAWTQHLRRVLREAESQALAAPRGPRPSIEEAFRALSRTPFEDGPVTRPGLELARDLGRVLGLVEHAYGDALGPFARAAVDRLAPELDAREWSRVVVAASLRAYVPQLDAHGAWAPVDEEASIYDLGLEDHPPQRLWSEMTRTALGIRVERGAPRPLLDGDVVLAAHGVPLAGVSVEQAEQLGLIFGERRAQPVAVTVLRAGLAAPLALELTRAPDAPAIVAAPSALALDEVPYGDGFAAVVAIPDVPDDLALRLERTLAKVRTRTDLRGVVLDVRANGGGSTDGAIAAIGLFLPGASLFPMRRRDGGIEIETAPETPAAERWDGPVASLVDGDTASAAEMIAGALGAYRRGVVVGERTYGKGCAQEYLDDDAHAGVLRLTTLVFALPDGAPVQKVGLAPQVRISLPAVVDREAGVARALDPWRGPDVRDPALVRDVPWPTHGGRVGPCSSDTVCRALRALGAAPAAAR